MKTTEKEQAVIETCIKYMDSVELDIKSRKRVGMKLYYLYLSKYKESLPKKEVINEE